MPKVQYPKEYLVKYDQEVAGGVTTNEATFTMAAAPGFDPPLRHYVSNEAAEAAARAFMEEVVQPNFRGEVINSNPRLFIREVSEWWEAETVPLFVVRLWDGFDGEWMDVSDPLPKAEATKLCGDKNEARIGSAAGKREGSYSDIDYYAVFPAATKMVFSEGRSQTGRS